MTIIQPTDTVSGTEATFAVLLTSACSSVEFYVTLGAFSRRVGVLYDPTFLDSATGGGVFQIEFDTTSLTTADGYIFKAVAMMGTTSVEATKIVKVDNSGPVVALTQSPLYSEGYILDISQPSEFTLQWVSGPAISKVLFYREFATTSSLIATVTTPPYRVSLSSAGLMVNTPVTVKAVAYTAANQQTVATLSGSVRFGSVRRVRRMCVCVRTSVRPRRCRVCVGCVCVGAHQCSDSLCDAVWCVALYCRSSVVGNEVFLKGKYIEVGIHSVASFGTSYVHRSAGAVNCSALMCASCWLLCQRCCATGFQRRHGSDEPVVRRRGLRCRCGSVAVSALRLPLS
jgi:hypothetical protein